MLLISSQVFCVYCVLSLGCQIGKTMNILVMIGVLLRYSHHIVTTGHLEQTLHTADAENPHFSL